MELKRYTTQELTNITEEIFYDYLSSDTNGIPNVKEVLDVYLNRLKVYNHRFVMLNATLEARPKDVDLNKITEELKEIQKVLPHIKNSNMAYQKKLYKQTKYLNFCRSRLEIPLNKKINSFYDDFSMEVLFYDDVCTPKGKISEYNMLTTKEERMNFLKANTEITNIALVYSPKGTRKETVISVKGNLNFPEKEAIEDSGITILPSLFADFKHLTLADINKIDNNDLKQFFQEKIDLDKENMIKLSSQLIRGDLYEIFEAPETENDLKIFYIRYVCRSTGRIYYNKLNLNNLSISKYFDRNIFDSYARAWWNLNTLGEDPDGEPVIRC